MAEDVFETFELNEEEKPYNIRHDLIISQEMLCCL
jgi:hypothetical protein